MKIVNIGSSNIDYVYQMEHFIQPGETLGCAQLSIGCGGKGLNQSIALARAGAEVYHAGLIGREGAFLREKMEQAGVNVEFVRYGEGANGHAIIQVDKTGQNCIILYGGTNHQFTHALVDEVLSHFAAGDIVVLQNEINEIRSPMRGCRPAAPSLYWSEFKKIFRQAKNLLFFTSFAAQFLQNCPCAFHLLKVANMV